LASLFNSLLCQIHENPELGYEEFKAHDNVASLLESLDYKVTRHAYGIQTALMAEFGSGGRVIAFNAEYDALPDIGHACGHNLIATMSIGAFIALADTLKRYKIQGRVRLLGTPAEEGGGGKLKLIEAGAYSDVDACMMIHPGPEDGCAGYTGDAYMPTLANKKFTVRFTGKAAHASMSPWQGVNALDAVVLGYSGVSALRQQILPTQRIHGVISEGGKRPNIITAHTSLDYYVRSTSLKSANALMERVIACFEGAAIQTGCKVETEL
jgi:amidohydrolase